MAIVESLETQPVSLSFELFPPQTPAGMERLQDVHQQLLRCGPEFFSVTYGAGVRIKLGLFKLCSIYKRKGPLLLRTLAALAPHVKPCLNCWSNIALRGFLGWWPCGVTFPLAWVDPLGATFVTPVI